jgi:hypothetical protein
MTTPHIAEADRAERVPGRVDHWLGAGLIALGAGLAVNSVLGPLAFGIVDYPLSETLRNQTLGVEAVSLLVVAPLSVVIGVLARRGHRAAPYGVGIRACLPWCSAWSRTTYASTFPRAPEQASILCSIRT